MQSFAKRGMMAVPRGKQRLRFLRRMRFNPPFLRAGYKQPRMEGFQQSLRSMLRRPPRRPRLRPLMSLAMWFFFIGDGRHAAFPG